MAGKRKVVVRVLVKVAVDPDAWNGEYWSEETDDDIRAAVAAMVGEGASMALAHLSHVLTVESEAK